MNKKINLSKVVGYIILIPSLISVVLFIIQLYDADSELLSMFEFTPWTGSYWTGSPTTPLTPGENGGGGYTSALPFYFGLMAIAGAYLIKDNKK